MAVDLAELIRTRRTHKAYAPAPSTAATLDELFELARWAPNHNLTNPWRFRVLGPEALARLKEAAGPEAAAKLDRAPTLVAASVVQDEDPVTAEEDFAAGACAVYIVLLAAHARGLGGYWRTPGVLRTPEGRAACGIADGERVLGLIHLGADARRQARARSGAAGGDRRPPAAEAARRLRARGRKPSGPGRLSGRLPPSSRRPMRRRLPALLIALALPRCWRPPRRRRAGSAAEPLDGPSADIVGVDDLDVARDGTGALVWRRRVDGAPHVFLSRLSGGAWRPPERVDGPIPEGADEASVAVADGGRLAVVWVSGSRVFGAFAPAGRRAAAAVGARAAARGGRRRAVRRARRRHGHQRHGLRGVARRPAPAAPTCSPRACAAGTFSLAPGAAGHRRRATPRARTRAARGSRSTRPASRSPTWGEVGSAVGPARCSGSLLSQLPAGGLPARAGRRRGHGGDRRGGGRLVRLGRVPPARRGRAARARPPARRPAPSIRAPCSTRAGRRPAVVSINGRGAGSALVPAGGGAVLAARHRRRQPFGAAGRLDTHGRRRPGRRSALSTADCARHAIAAWRRDAGDGDERGDRALPRARPAVGGRGAALAARLRARGAGARCTSAATRNGDTAVAMLQGAGGRPAGRRRRLRPAARPRLPAAGGWVREAQPVLRLERRRRPAGASRASRCCSTAPGRSAGSRARRRCRRRRRWPTARTPCRSITVDRRGQAMASGVRTFRIDTVVPTAARARQRQAPQGPPVRVRRARRRTPARASRRISVDYGDGRAAPRRR